MASVISVAPVVTAGKRSRRDGRISVDFVLFLALVSAPIPFPSMLSSFGKSYYTLYDGLLLGLVVGGYVFFAHRATRGHLFVGASAVALYLVGFIWSGVIDIGPTVLWVLLPWVVVNWSRERRIWTQRTLEITFWWLMVQVVIANLALAPGLPNAGVYTYLGGENRTTAAFVLLVAAMIRLGISGRKVVVYGCLAFAAALLSTSQSGLGLAIGVFGIWAFVHFGRRRFLAALGLGMLAGLGLVYSSPVANALDELSSVVVPSQEATDNRSTVLRANALEHSADVFWSSPWLGTGGAAEFPRGPKALIGDYILPPDRVVRWSPHGPMPTDPHNSFVLLGLEFGALGFLLVSWIFVRTTLRGPRVRMYELHWLAMLLGGAFYYTLVVNPRYLVLLLALAPSCLGLAEGSDPHTMPVLSTSTYTNKVT